MSLTGMALGGVTAVGLPPGLPVWIDTRVMTRHRVILGSGSRSSKIVAAPGFLADLPGAEVVEGLAREP
jgi:prolyl-tRNA editing enzyme YbaK/EbsC (Cys-tRNA(Pro) deacylase)